MPVQVVERLDRCECFVSRLRIVVAEVVVVGVRLLVEVLAGKPERELMPRAAVLTTLGHQSFVFATTRPRPTHK